jgi:hypothetical protein
LGAPNAVLEPDPWANEAVGLLVDKRIPQERYDAWDHDGQDRLDAVQDALRRLALEAVSTARTLPPFDSVVAHLPTWLFASSTWLLQNGQTVDADERARAATALRDLLAIYIARVVPDRIRRGRYEVDVVATPAGQALFDAVSRAGKFRAPVSIERPLD